MSLIAESSSATLIPTEDSTRTTDAPLDASSQGHLTLRTVDSPEVLSVPPSFHWRLAYFISVWSFKAAITFALGAYRLFQRRNYDLLVPTVRVYPVRPDLKNRIFRPDVPSNEKLPLYLDIHGGGWAVADPETDDEFCSFMAREFNMIVVSIDYHKSPRYKFPYAVYDVADIVDAILNDASLNVDLSKVVMSGFSAGGNLAFAASQIDLLRGRINALIGFYLPLDLTETLEVKLSRRAKDSPSDKLASSAKFLDWAYVPPGTDRQNPLLSPRWADPRDLPPNVYLIGAEYDMLCHEAGEMAEELVRAKGGERTAIEGVNVDDGWQQGGVRWECARGRQHAFTHVTKWGRQAEKRRVKACEELYGRLGVWLRDDVWERESIP